MIASCTRCAWRGVPTLTHGRPKPGEAMRYVRHLGGRKPTLVDCQVDEHCPACRAPIRIAQSEVRSPRQRSTIEEAMMESPEQGNGGEELREDDVSAADNLDDRVSEAEGLPAGGGTAEGEDASHGQAPASSDASDGQDEPDGGQED